MQNLVGPARVPFLDRAIVHLLEATRLIAVAQTIVLI